MDKRSMEKALPTAPYLRCGRYQIYLSLVYIAEQPQLYLTDRVELIPEAAVYTSGIGMVDMVILDTLKNVSSIKTITDIRGF